MPKQATALQMEIDEPKSIIEEYKELEAACDQVLEKITKRKTRKVTKTGRKQKK